MFCAISVYLLLSLIGQQHDIGARQRRVSDIMELLDRNIREHADINCILHINATSDSSGHIYVVNHIYCKIQANSASHGLQRKLRPWHG